MTLAEIQIQIEEYIISNKGREGIFVSATATSGGAEDVRALLGANDPFTCAVMVVAVLEACIGLCEHRKNFEAEKRFIQAKGACTKIFEIDTDHPAETTIGKTKDYR